MAEHHVDRQALNKACEIVEDEAKRVLGTYDYAWPPLAPSTVASKAGGDTPGLETGEMRDSIEHTVEGKSGQVGTDMDRAFWFELGTSRQPPRSFLLEAAMRKSEEVAKEVGEEVFLFLGTGRLRGAHTIRRYP